VPFIEAKVRHMVEFIAELPDQVFKNILHKIFYSNNNSKFVKGLNSKGYGKHACYSPLIPSNELGQLGVITQVRGSNNNSVIGNSALFNDCLTEVIDGGCVLNNNDFKDCEYNNTNIGVKTDKLYDTSCDVTTNNISIDVKCVLDNARVDIHSKVTEVKMYSKCIEVKTKSLCNSPELAVSSTADIVGEIASQAALHEADLAFYNGSDMDSEKIDGSNIRLVIYRLTHVLILHKTREVVDYSYINKLYCSQTNCYKIFSKKQYLSIDTD
jgi:hypothetical protein